jgi:hypothetical protein
VLWLRSAGHQEVTTVLRPRDACVVIRPTPYDLAILRQVLTPGTQRGHFLPFVAYDPGNQLPALERVKRATDASGFGDVQ